MRNHNVIELFAVKLEERGCDVFQLGFLSGNWYTVY